MPFQPVAAKVTLGSVERPAPCVEGLAELVRLNGDKELAQAVLDGMQAISDDEIIGSGSCQELWAYTALSQTRPLGQPHETCVTLSWLPAVPADTALDRRGAIR